MKKTQSFSIYALIIALLIHVMVMMLFLLLDKIVPVPEKTPPEEEQRFKVSLKERPNAQQEAALPNTQPKLEKVRPLPRGEQLKKITQTLPQPKAQPIQKEIQRPAEPVPVAKPQETKTEPSVEPKKAFERHTAKEVAKIERTPKKDFNLFDKLSTPDGSAQNLSQGSVSKVSDNIQRLYGDKFSELSEGEQKYILDNQEVMRRITQGVLDRYGRSRIPDNIRVNDTNMIEFYLHPDGSISDIRFLKNSRFSILDDTTKETIEIAYSKYPRPAQKTYIRYRVWYNLN